MKKFKKTNESCFKIHLFINSRSILGRLFVPLYSVDHCKGWITWSNITISVSRRRWHATFNLCFSETVRSATLVCLTWLNPRSSIRAFIRPLVSRPLVRVPGSRRKEWKSRVWRTDISGVNSMFCSTRATLSSRRSGVHLNIRFGYF